MNLPQGRPMCTFGIVPKWASAACGSGGPPKAGLVLIFQQPPRDDLRLNLGGAFEDVEDARVAEDAAHRIFHCESVAAVNLHRVVGGGPGDAGAEELRHAGLEVAAPSRVLLACG